MYKNILVPIALDHERDVAEALAVAELLVDKGAKITALHVMEEVPSYVAQYFPENQVQKNLQMLKDQLNKDLEGHPGVTAKVVTGHAGHAIVDYAKAHQVDCIVVASHRPGLQDFFLGSTAARVVRHAPCAVHVSR